MTSRLLKYAAACAAAEAIAILWTPPELRVIIGVVWGVMLVGMAVVVWQTAEPSSPTEFAYLDDPDFDGIVIPAGRDGQ